MAQIFAPLTENNIKVGSIVRSIAHPEWGTFRVTGKTEFNGCTWYDIEERTLFITDFHFWEVRIN